MKRFIRFMAPLISLTVFSLVGARAQSPSASNKAAATIAGRVTLNGDGASGVHVMLKPHIDKVFPNITFGGEQTPSVSVVTDAEGRYRLTDVGPGAYRVSVFAPVYVVSGEEEPLTPGKTVNIAEGDKVENVDFSLKRGAVITGKVTDDNDRPVIAAPVRAYTLNIYGYSRAPSDSSSRYFRWETDDRGVYRIFGLEPGRYKVAAGVDSAGGSMGGGYRQTFHPDASDEEQARVIEVSSGEEAANVDIKVAAPVKSYAVTGRVVDDDSGNPVPGVMVTYTGGSGFRTGRPVTNALGEFRFENLTPDRYRAYIINVNEQGLNAPTFGQEINFVVVDSDVSGLEIRMPRGTTISGVVAIEGSKDVSLRAKLAQVSLYVQSGSRTMFSMGLGANGTISPNGTFKLSNVQPGKTSIVTGFDDLKGFALQRIEHNGVDVQGFNVNAGDQITGVRLVFSYGNAVIAGRVEVKGGSLPPGARMRVSCMREGERSTVGTVKFIDLDGRGQFLIESLTPGTYKLSLLFLGYGDAHPPRIEQNVSVAGESRHEVTFIVDLPSKDREK